MISHFCIDLQVTVTSQHVQQRANMGREEEDSKQRDMDVHNANNEIC